MRTREEYLIAEFNAFIKEWCKDSYPHLIDTDDNAGERFRNIIRKVVKQLKRSSNT